MNTRLCLNVLLLVFASLITTNPGLAQTQERPPNVIVMLIDDAGYADFGFLGETDLRTPHMDRLAAEGVSFTQAYVSGSVCCPSRAGLLTGRYQQRFGHEFNGPNQAIPPYQPADAGLAVTEYTLGDVFQANGYATQCVGKWHMGSRPERRQYDPLVRGFDEFYGLEAGHRHYFTHTDYERREAYSFLMRDNWEYIPEADITYVTDDQAAAAMRFIRRHADQPFFIYLSYTAVHGPTQAKPEDIALFDYIENNRRRTYAAMMKAMDDSVGHIRALLEDLGLTENTLIILTNDNGGPIGNGSRNAPLRGNKGTLWEGGTRVPFVMSMPGTLPEGEVRHAPIITLDILPTALAAADLPDPFAHARPLDGVNLMPYALGESDTQPHETLYWRHGTVAAVRHGNWKLIRVERSPDILIDLANDPFETTNLAGQHPDVVAQLHELLTQWESELAPPRWNEGQRWDNNRIDFHQMDWPGRG